ncbi:alpha/beta fold hydrolase [Methylobacterium nigriterrae]|uniref:alpha/beta fold hydrolase n=1 Tax=Methylobacterium nigriterrae TaxID=3127512 RepID=UPI0030132692
MALPGTQSDVFFTTDLSATNPTDVQIYGKYTTLPGSGDGGTLLILVHGATYDHRYWDMPNVGSQYSLPDSAQSAGYATLAIDRLGNGRSSKPAATDVTLDNQADELHEIIGQVKAGALGKTFDKIVVVGHSYGSAVSITEAGKYNDADGLLATGFPINSPLIPLDFSTIQLGSDDPNLSPGQQQPGYVTLKAGFRSDFYDTTDADPRVIAQDDAIRQTATIGERQPAPEIAKLITVPVLTIIGANDSRFVVGGDGEPLARAESDGYTSASSHQTIIVPMSGHNLQLQISNDYYEKELFDWISRITTDPNGGRLVRAGNGDDIQAGDDKANVLVDGGGNDILLGKGGDDLFEVASGRNRIDGGTGVDTAKFNVAFKDASFAFTPKSVTVSTAAGTTTLTGVEHFTFSDRSFGAPDDTPLVDELFYFGSNGDVFAAGVDAATHYATFGWKEGRDPNALFSTNGYLAANKGTIGSNVDPLKHYDASGWKEGRDPSANFDNERYLAANPDVKASGQDPLKHYLEYGEAEGRQTYAAVGRPGDLQSAKGFDAEYYLLANPDVAKAALAAPGGSFAFAQQHFDTFGWHEGRNPNAVFDTKGYLAAYGDVAQANINPLVHYETFGWKEGRDPSASFDGKAYLATYGDVKAAGIDPMLHYLQFGGVEGRSAFADGHFG